MPETKQPVAVERVAPAAKAKRAKKPSVGTPTGRWIVRKPITYLPEDAEIDPSNVRAATVEDVLDDIREDDVRVFIDAEAIEAEYQ